MTAFWQFFLPLFAAGFAAAIIAGRIGFRGDRLRRSLACGAAAALAFTLLWDGPLGAAGRFAATVEHEARFVLDDWEMPAVSGHLQRAPLTRRLELSGPADNFQRRELAKLMSLVPGVGRASWSRDRAIPLVIEAAVTALLGFLLGLMLAYFIELRRRHNAQWSW